jgi:MoxR-like ATPase
MAEVAIALDSIDAVGRAFRAEGYVSARGLATAVFLALKLGRPLFLEGEAGVGKTEVAKVLSRVLGAELVRLQCYEGLDVHQAVYEWNYARQMLHIRLLEARGDEAREADLFGPDFLLERPLLRAIRPGGGPKVLLVDEIDRSDEEFEAFLLEVLSDFQVTIPEIGTVRAERPPVVIVTSNRTRDVHDALRRRCVYHWIDYPSLEDELAIVRARMPDAPDRLAREVTAFIQELRRAELYKRPGVAETLDWAAALLALDQQALDPAVVDETLGVVLKYEDDLGKVRGSVVRAIHDRVQVAT